MFQSSVYLYMLVLVEKSLSVIDLGSLRVFTVSFSLHSPWSTCYLSWSIGKIKNVVTGFRLLTYSSSGQSTVLSAESKLLPGSWSGRWPGLPAQFFYIFLHGDFPFSKFVSKIEPKPSIYNNFLKAIHL